MAGAPLRADPRGPRGARACRRRASTEFWASDGLIVPQQPDDGGQLRALPRRSGRRDRCRRRAARSRSSPRPSPASARPTAPAIRPGSRRCDVPAPTTPLHARRQPAGDAAAQPARFRRPQRRLEASRPRGRAHASRRRRGARHRRRRHRPPVQRARRLPRRRARHRRHPARRRPAADRRLVRSRRSRRRTRRSACTAIRTC